MFHMRVRLQMLTGCEALAAVCGDEERYVKPQYGGGHFDLLFKGI